MSTYYYKTIPDADMYKDYKKRTECKLLRRIPAAVEFAEKHNILLNGVRLDGPYVCVDEEYIPKEIESQFKQGNPRYLKRNSKLNKEWAKLMNEIDPEFDMFGGNTHISILHDFDIRWYVWRCTGYFVSDNIVYFKSDMSKEDMRCVHMNDYIEIAEIEYKEKELEFLKAREARGKNNEN